MRARSSLKENSPSCDADSSPLKKILATFKKKIIKATEILEKNDKTIHKSWKCIFTNIHLMHTNHREYTNALPGLSNHQGETNGLHYFFVGNGEREQTRYYVLAYCNFTHIIHIGTINWVQVALSSKDVSKSYLHCCRKQQCSGLQEFLLYQLSRYFYALTSPNSDVSTKFPHLAHFPSWIQGIPANWRLCSDLRLTGI